MTLPMSLADEGVGLLLEPPYPGWKLCEQARVVSLSADEACVGAWSTQERGTEQGEHCWKASWDPSPATDTGVGMQ